MPLTFVNYLGKPVDTTPPKVKREPKKREPAHMGWAAFGISPEQLEAGRRKARAEEKEFDLEAFLRLERPIRITKRNYSSPWPAHAACEIAAKQGWPMVMVKELRSE